MPIPRPFTAKSAIVRGSHSNTPLEAKPAPNPHTGDRIIGHLADGEKVIVAIRPGGSGGMEFSKLLGGKVYAVAADGFSPVIDKDTKKQKVEDGLPLFSSSGLYLLSSKEYPALHAFEAFTRLAAAGQVVLTLSVEQLSRQETFTLDNEFELDMLVEQLRSSLTGTPNLFQASAAQVNKKREREIRTAKEEAEDRSAPYQGVDYCELPVSPRSGSPFLAICVRIPDSSTPPSGQALTLFVEEAAPDGKPPRLVVLGIDQALHRWTEGELYARIKKRVLSGLPVEVSWACGYAVRTSVSFKKKVDNALSPTDRGFGDSAYIKSALGGWARGIVATMFSRHPGFPRSEYDALHFVAAPRQAELQMTRRIEGQPPTAPTVPVVPLGQLILQHASGGAGAGSAAQASPGTSSHTAVAA